MRVSNLSLNLNLNPSLDQNLESEAQSISNLSGGREQSNGAVFQGLSRVRRGEAAPQAIFFRVALRYRYKRDSHQETHFRP